MTISDLETHLGYWLRMVSNSVSHGFARKLEAEDITVAEWVFMRKLFDADGVAPSRLAERMGMTKGAISKLADRLIAKRLVTRTASDEDRRGQTLALTAEGKRLDRAVRKVEEALYQQLGGQLGADTINKALALLRPLVAGSAGGEAIARRKSAEGKR